MAARMTNNTMFHGLELLLVDDHTQSDVLLRLLNHAASSTGF
jgi:hypothetical protein